MLMYGAGDGRSIGMLALIGVVVGGWESSGC
jgi:hypothetical protein